MTNKERQQARFERDRARRAQKRLEDEKKYCDYNKIISVDSLAESFHKCCKNVRWKSSTQNFEMHSTREIFKLYNILTKDGDVSRGYHHFTIMERGKRRQIESCHISERVVQKSFSDNCYSPLFEKHLIENNCASQVGKGASKAIENFNDDLIKAQRRFKGDFYVLQGDFKNYFGSVPHEQLIEMIDKYIHNEHIRVFYRRLINSHEDVGMGLGSQNNQNFAALYLNDLDHYITNQLHQKFYGRYNDDFYLMVKTKEEAKEFLNIICDFIGRKGLELSEKKTKIVKSTHMLIFLKQRFILKSEGRVCILPNKKSAVRLRRKLKSFKKKLNNREMTYKCIEQSYKSSMGVFHGRFCYFTKQNLYQLYNELFIYDWCHNHQ